MKVLVTGANGFLGRYVVQELLREGFLVRVLVRSKRQIEQLPWSRKVEVFEGDLRYHEDLSASFINIDALIHLAANKRGDEEAQFDSTVVGTERLLEAMSRSQARRIIFISSLSVYNYRNLDKTLTENSPLDDEIYDRDGYAITKIWQERVVKKLSRKYGWDLTVLRPGMVWGEIQEYPLVLSIPLGPLHAVVAPMKRANVVHVENCAKAIVSTIKSTDAIGKTINIIDRENPSSWEFLGKYLEATGSKGFRIPVPYSISYPLVKAIYGVSRWILKEDLKVPSLFVPSRFQARFKPFTCSTVEADKLMEGIKPLDLNSSFEHLRESVKQGIRQ